MVDLQTAIERGDIVDFKAICRTLEPKELFKVYIQVGCQFRQFSLQKAAHNILIERGIIR